MKITLPNILISTLCVIVLILGFFQFTSKTSIVFVDSAKLINSYTGMINARKTYQQKATAWKANIDTLANEVHQQIVRYEKENPKMTVKERQLSQELIRAKQKQLADFQQAMNTKAQQEDNNMTKGVIEEVNAYLKKYGKEHGYQIILAATEYGNIAYAEDALDITDQVLIGLNKNYAGQ